jgi:predicted DCC family thiol-disulfide oxidoreductase YuxK
MPLRNGWTGGQYSVFRALFGAYLFVHFAELMPWAKEMFSNRGVMPQADASPLLHLFPNILAVCDSPCFVTVFLLVGVLLSVFFAIGYFDRVAALALWYIWACLLGRNPLISNPSLPYVGLLLLAHACLPSAPYGSVGRRGRPDAGSEWRMPQSIFLVVWILMSVGYAYSGYTKLVSPSWIDGTAIARVLANPLARENLLNRALIGLPESILKVITWGALALELSFAPLALFRRTRPYVWGLMLGMHIGLIALIDFADLSIGMLMLHLFTFDPAWIRRRTAGATETIFYDGGCGLCHRAVRFVLAEDRAADSFRFSPLNSQKFFSSVPAENIAVLPDSIVVQTADGTLLIKSTALIYVGKRLGGVWRLLAGCAETLPVSWRDKLYDVVAGSRHRLFRAPEEVCPVIPAKLRNRFDF